MKANAIRCCHKNKKNTLHFDGFPVSSLMAAVIAIVKNQTPTMKINDMPSHRGGLRDEIEKVIMDDRNAEIVKKPPTI